MNEEKVELEVNITETRNLDDIIKKTVGVRFISNTGEIELNTFIKVVDFLLKEYKDATKMVCFAHGGIVLKDVNEKELTE